MKQKIPQGLNGWVQIAKAHWKEYLPTLYKDLQKSGQLQMRLIEAAELTAREMDELMESEYNYPQAWMMVRNEYLIIPGEEIEDAEPESEYFKTLREIAELQIGVNEHLDELGTIQVEPPDPTMS